MPINVRVIGFDQRLDRQSSEPFESYRKIFRGLDQGDMDLNTRVAHPTSFPNKLNAVIFGLKFGLDHQLLEVQGLNRDPQPTESAETVLDTLAISLEAAYPRRATETLDEPIRPDKLLVVSSTVLLNRLVNFSGGHEVSHSLNESTDHPVHYVFQPVSP